MFEKIVSFDSGEAPKTFKRELFLLCLSLPLVSFNYPFCTFITFISVEVPIIFSSYFIIENSASQYAHKTQAIGCPISNTGSLALYN